MPVESNHREQFILLFLSSESAIRGYIASVMVCPAERQDVFQEVALVLWKNFPSYDSARPFTPWALGVAARKLKEAWKRHRRAPELLPQSALDAMAASFREILAYQPLLDRENALRQCLTELPEPSRGLVTQRYFENHSVEQMAASLGQSANNLAQTLCRLRRRLGECIQRRLKLEEQAVRTPSLLAITTPTASKP